MKQRAKIWLAAGLITMVAGGGTAYAATTTQSANTNTNTTKHAAFGHGDFKQGFAFGSQELLTLLNITQADLKTDLQSGKSLADIAKAQGVDEQKVIDLLVKERTTQIDKAVTDGKLTQDKATTEKANLAAQVKKMVESAPKQGDFKGGFQGRGPGQPFQSQALLTLLNITQADLGTALKSGQSLADIAKSKGVDEQKVIDLLVQERTTQIDKMVTDGKLTQDKATTEKANIAAQVKKMVESAPKQGDFKGDFKGGFPGGFAGGHGPGQEFQSQALLTLLNITQADLGTALKSGQSLADIAKSKGVDEQKVIDLLVQERTTQIDKAVTDGKLTQDQATTEKSKLADQVKKMVESAHKQGDFQGRRGGFHKGGQQDTQSQTQAQSN